MIATDMFRLNAYRVLRVPANASVSDIQKAADRMRRAEPGVYRTSDNRFISLCMFISVFSPLRT